MKFIRPNLFLAELALLLTSVIAVLGFDVLFDADTWRRPVLVSVVVAHCVAALLRRSWIPGPIVGPLFVLGGVLTVSQLHYSSTTRYRLPTRETLDLLGDDLEVAANAFPDVIAPTEPLVGFVVALTAVVWLLAGAADAIAFRAKLTLSSLIPVGAMVTFASILGKERNTGRLLLLLALGVTFVIAHRRYLLPGERRWLSDPTETRRAATRGSAPVAATAALGALLLVPVIPSAETPLIDPAGRGGGGGTSTRVVISPLVDIQARLVDQADVEVFQVRSPEPAYWRLTSLDTFDSNVWSSRANYDDVNQSLDVAVESGTDTRTINQTFKIEALAAVWLPAAFQPQAITNLESADVSWESESATLIVDRSSDTSDGISYQIESAVPSFSAAELAAMPAGAPPEFDKFTELPSDFSPQAAALAQEITFGLQTPYERALALQSFFRDNFTYDLEVAAGHDISRIEDFLEIRIGYCEQFAGTFAAMARSLSIPARVAVGFTWGDVNPEDPSLYRVRGEHAHAWPEIYIEGAGWVAFEPTPGRGAPNAGYTNVPQAQDETGSETPVDGSGLSPAIPNTEEDIGPNLPEEDLGSGLASGTLGEDEGAGGSNVSFPIWPLYVLLAALLLAGLVSAGPWLAQAVRRRRASSAGSNTQQVMMSWEESLAALGALSIRPASTDTNSEFVKKVTPLIGNQPDLVRLGQIVDQARFSATDLPVEATEQAAATKDTIVESVRERTTRWDRYRAEWNYLKLAALSRL